MVVIKGKSEYEKLCTGFFYF